MPRNVTRILTGARVPSQQFTRLPPRKKQFPLIQQHNSSNTSTSTRSNRYEPYNDDNSDDTAKAPSPSSLNKDKTELIRAQEVLLLHECRDKLQNLRKQLEETTSAAQEIPFKYTSILRPTIRDRAYRSSNDAAFLPSYTISALRGAQAPLPAATTATVEAIDHLDTHLRDLILEDFPSHTVPPTSMSSSISTSVSTPTTKKPSSPTTASDELASLVTKTQSTPSTINISNSNDSPTPNANDDDEERSEKRVWQADLDRQVAQLSESEKKTLLQDWRYEEEARLRRLEQSGDLFAQHVREIQAMGAGKEIEFWGDGPSGRFGGVVGDDDPREGSDDFGSGSGSGRTALRSAKMRTKGKEAVDRRNTTSTTSTTTAAAAAAEVGKHERSLEMQRREEGVSSNSSKREEEVITDWEALEDGIGNPETDGHHDDKGEEYIDSSGHPPSSPPSSSSSLPRKLSTRTSSPSSRKILGERAGRRSPPSSPSSPPSSKENNSKTASAKSNGNGNGNGGGLSLRELQRRLSAVVTGRK